MSDTDDNKNAMVSIRTLRPGLPEDKIVEVDSKPHKPLPEKYSLAIHNEITRMVSRGMNPASAAGAAGITKNNWAAWQRMVADGDAHPSIIQLFEDIERAYHMFTANAMNTIVATDDEGNIKNAENAKWALERSRANEYAPKLNVMMQSEIQVMFDKLENEFRSDPEILDRIYKALA